MYTSIFFCNSNENSDFFIEYNYLIVLIYLMSQYAFWNGIFGVSCWIYGFSKLAVGLIKHNFKSLIEESGELSECSNSTILFGI